ncbi:MAG: O-antigen ligase family protein [Candidatus Omnitrophota bacterium]|nr:O-antigen ligase family protein [Candidatus Omnitrophota bacterium]
MKDRVYNLFVVTGEYSLYGLLFSLAISNGMVESFAGLALFGFVGRKIIKPDLKYLKFWPNAFLLLFLFFSALSLFNSGAYFNKSLHALFGKWMQYLGIYIIVQDTARDRRISEWGMSVFLFGASLAVLSGLSQYFFNIEFLRHNCISMTTKGTRAIVSTFAHYNGFGGYIVVVLSFLLASLLVPKMPKIKTYSILTLIILSIAAVLLTFSRGSWIALAVSFILLSIFSRRNLKWLAPIFLVTIVLFFLPIFHERLIFTFKEGGDADRYRYWLTAWKMISEHPFLGMGLGTFMGNFSKYSVLLLSPAYAHNCYLQIWAETGIFSLISFLVFVFSIVYLGVKKFIVTKDFLLLGLLAGVIGFLVHSFFETNLYSLRLAILFWVWVGLISARIIQREKG